ncbi:MAG: class I SAM-dependent methyltransferase [Parachlamydiaceae bacterium]
MKKVSKTTSWEKVDKWYNNAVGEKGHHYHQHVIFPNLFKQINIKKAKSLIDLGCGQGVLARYLPKQVAYLGIDLSPSLIRNAKQLAIAETHEFAVGDVTKELKIVKNDFDVATMILCLQNMKDPFAAINNTSKLLKKGGAFIIVLNHPCFRIPRQSSWQVDHAKKIQYRRIDRYLTPLEVPIDMHPGKKPETQTWSFHHALKDYFSWLNQAGFSVTNLDEWCSDKESTGGAAKMENRARNEFPLFLTIFAQKN